MKIFFLLIALLISNTLLSQYVAIPSHPINNEYCPEQEFTFTATISGNAVWTNPNESRNPRVAALAYFLVTSVNPPSYNSNTGITTFNFVGKFNDVSVDQIFRVTFRLQGETTDRIQDFTYRKILSFSALDISSKPQPSISLPINANRCQSQNFNISFNNVLFANNTANPKLEYGNVTSYEYQIPSNWILNGITSNGSNWIAGSNNVTITSNLTNGDGQNILIRAINSCGSNLIKGPVAVLPISRPRPPLTITGDDFICSDSKNYNLTGTLTSGASVCWSSSNTNIATVPSSNCGTTIPLSYVQPGVVNLTATITDCIETYSITPMKILIGAAVDGYYKVVSNYTTGNFTLYNNNSPLWLPANQGFEISVYLTSPGLEYGSWSRASTSYPFSFNTSGTFLSFGGTSGSSAYQERKGIFNLSAQTKCGSVNGTYSWPVIVQGWSAFSMDVSPNPATTEVNLVITEESPEVKALNKNENILIELIDLYSGKTVKLWNFKNDQRRFNLNIRGIRKGQYILTTTIGKYKQSKNLIIAE
jgi:hypothetical protein